MTQFKACPSTCGAAAVIVCRDRFATRHNANKTVEILAQSMTTDLPNSHEDSVHLAGYDMTGRPAQQVVLGGVCVGAMYSRGNKSITSYQFKSVLMTKF
ncbi:hypothetical protein [Lysinibacillus xylanilyticus]|uniref:hypothetical protein n=1 Tax=Lysinibacillus xylanilyticus TaxID=582475 RepID=UPI00380674DD